MRKPALVRAVYAQLRQMLGDEHPAGAVLKMANLLVSAYKDPQNELSEYGVPYDSRPFATLPIDEAFKDGGWRVLSFENKMRSPSAESGDPSELMHIARALDEYLGIDWRHYDWIGHGLSSND